MLWSTDTFEISAVTENAKQMSHHSSYVSEQHISGKVITITDNNTFLEFGDVLTVWFCFAQLILFCRFGVLSAHLVETLAAIVEPCLTLKPNIRLMQILSELDCFILFFLLRVHKHGNCGAFLTELQQHNAHF